MKFHGQFDPPVDQFLYKRYFTTRSAPGLFVECGAFDGITESSCLFFEETLGWRGLNIEPSPVIFCELMHNRPKSENINIALSDQSGCAIFHQVIHPRFGELCTNGSLAHAPEHRARLIDDHCEFRDYAVKTATWNDLVLQHGLADVDLFVLDVEGHELSVLRGMCNCRVIPRILCVEHSFVDRKELFEATSLLGYRFDVSLFVNSYFVWEGK